MYIPYVHTFIYIKPTLTYDDLYCPFYLNRFEISIGALILGLFLIFHIILYFSRESSVDRPICGIDLIEFSLLYARIISLTILLFYIRGIGKFFFVFLGIKIKTN